jgi:DNA-binding transcriptional ArsR family regulator
MTRVLLTNDDLAHTRFGEAPAPLVETVMGLVALRRRLPAAVGSGWPGWAWRAFPPRARPLWDLIPRCGYWPEFLDPLVGDLEAGLDMVCATPRRVLREQLAMSWKRAARPPSWLRCLADGKREALETVRRGLRDFHDACIAPHWAGIVASFRADMAARIPLLATHGLARVFSTLHADLAWRDGVLDRAGRTGEYSLDGSGLQMMPSALWPGPPLFAIGPPELGGNALIYAARRPAEHVGANGSRELAAVLGRTRTAALAALGEPCGTAELAARLGISAPSASEHAKALRAADLIQTVRRGRGVQHFLTPLGQSLLNGNHGSGCRR